MTLPAHFRKRRAHLAELRQLVYARDDGRCHLCGWIVPEDVATLDHLEPRVGLGPTTARNLAIAHKACNMARGELPMDVVLEVLASLRARGVKPDPVVVPLALRRRVQEWRRDRRYVPGPSALPAGSYRRVAKSGRFGNL